MKAFDAYLDKNARDSGFDILASRFMSREVDNSLRFQPGERHRFSLDNNYSSVACPIIPIGLLGAFFMLGKLDTLYGNGKEPLKLEATETQRERGELTQAVYLAAMKQKLEAERKKDGSMLCSRPTDSFLLSDKKDSTSIRKRKDVALMLEGKRSERINGPSLLAKAQTTVSRLVKEKMHLESHLDKLLCQQQDYSAVCRVSARLELLEKALKKLGC